MSHVVASRAFLVNNSDEKQSSRKAGCLLVSGTDALELAKNGCLINSLERLVRCFVFGQDDQAHIDSVVSFRGVSIISNMCMQSFRDVVQYFVHTLPLPVDVSSCST